jgi:hypothetical protein
MSECLLLGSGGGLRGGREVSRWGTLTPRQCCNDSPTGHVISRVTQRSSHESSQ